MALAEEPSPITSHVEPDAAVVRAFLKEMIAKGAFQALITAIVALVIKMRDLNTELTRRLATAHQAHPPSETSRRLELELALGLGTSSAANDVAAPPSELPKREPKKRPREVCPHGRAKLPEHLTRVPEICLVAPALALCPDCNVVSSHLTFKAHEVLEVVPAHYFVRRILRETVACQQCRTYVRTADNPDEIVDRGCLGPSLVVEAIVDHYDDAVPWERMERNARLQGVPLAANTLAATAGRVIDLLEPVVDHIKEACLASAFTALDATRMPVLDRAHPLGIRNGSLWLIEGDHRYACFVYAPTAEACYLEAVLERGALQSVMCDGSATNNPVDRAGGKRGGCNAHGRRGLVQAFRKGDRRALDGIELYAAIFHVDADSLRLGDSLDARFARRLARAAPLVEELRLWVVKQRAQVEPKCPLGKALNYLHRQWDRLTAFLHDPLMELTNNEVERDLRRWVLDRKSWLFVGNDRSAHRAACAMTLLTTCRKMGLDPRKYLAFALKRLLAGEKKLAALLPETFALELRDASRA